MQSFMKAAGWEILDSKEEVLAQGKEIWQVRFRYSGLEKLPGMLNIGKTETPVPNPVEDYAESFERYFMRPDLLTNSVRYTWMRHNVFLGREYLKVSTRPTRIQVPKIYLDQPVVSLPYRFVETSAGLVREAVPDNCYPGIHQESVNPDQVGNVIISGHSNIGCEVFRTLPLLERDDRINLYDANGIVYPYIVEGKIVVKDVGVSGEQRIKNGAYVSPTPDKRLTLITCLPSDVNYRVIIIAKPGY